MYIFIYVHMYTHRCTLGSQVYTHAQSQTQTHTQTQTQIHICIYKQIFIYVCIHIYVRGLYEPVYLCTGLLGYWWCSRLFLIYQVAICGIHASYFDKHEMKWAIKRPRAAVDPVRGRFIAETLNVLMCWYGLHVVLERTQGKFNVVTVGRDSNFSYLVTVGHNSSFPWHLTRVDWHGYMHEWIHDIVYMSWSTMGWLRLVGSFKL